jgi:sugar phosphate isomerase/epimerase
MPKEVPQIGVVAAALSGDARQAARLARQLGFAGLQFDSRSSSIDLTQLSASGRREFRHMLTSQDQQLIGLRSESGPLGFAPGADVDRALAHIEKIIEAAAGLGVPLVCVDLGPLPPAPQTAPPKPRITPAMAGLILLPEPASKPPAPETAPPPADPTMAAQITAAMDELGRRADRFSVMLAFRSELASLASLKQAVTLVSCHWFGVDLDPVAILRDTWDIDEVFSQLGPLIRHVRGRDALVGADRRTKPAIIGQGRVDWPTLLHNLDQSAYRGWITVDPVELPDRQAAATEGRAVLSCLQS